MGQHNPTKRLHRAENLNRLDELPPANLRIVYRQDNVDTASTSNNLYLPDNQGGILIDSQLLTPWLNKILQENKFLRWFKPVLGNERVWLYFINAYPERSKDLYTDTSDFLDSFEDLNKSVDWKHNEYMLKMFFLSINRPSKKKTYRSFR